ncbi:MAG: ATP synthase F1 subunit epsilon [Janthinobacterium lividum]
MAATYTLDVVTPERIMLSEDVTQTIAPGSEGQLGILASHAPLMTELSPGEVLVTLADGRTLSHIIISGGFMEVAPNGGHTTILADSAERADEIDVTRAEADLAAAQQMLSDTEVGSDQQAEARRSVAHAETRIRVSRRS